MSRPRHDVAIVGAGPAGATAAILLARAGARVVLVDKATFPRDKLCGEFVSSESARILDRLGVLEDLSRISARASSVLLSAASGRSISVPLPGPDGAPAEALGISRLEMDAVLIERAARAGAEVVQGFEARGALFEDGRAAGILGAARGASREVEIPARFVLAADGRESQVARSLDPASFRARASRLFAVKAHYTGVAGFTRSVELHYFPGGYVGMHAIGGGRVNVCALIDRRLARGLPRDPDRMVREVFFANPMARERLTSARRVSDWYAVGSLVFRAEEPVRAGALFLGDAAGTIDPFAGEGMSMAFRSAEIASDEIANCLGGSGGSAAPAEDALPRVYARRWRREFDARIRICRAIGRAVGRPALQGAAIGLLQAIPVTGRLLVRGTRAGVSLTRRAFGEA